jgi:ribonucleoside-diphosphate reductase alpha chain
MSRHRGYFVDQSQSLNLFKNAIIQIDINAFFTAWQSTENVLLENKSCVDAIKFT